MLTGTGLVLLGTSLQARQASSPPAGKRGLAGTWEHWESYYGIALPMRRIRLETRGDSLFASRPNGLRLAGRAAGDSVVLRGTDRTGRTSVVVEALWRGDSLIGAITSGGTTNPLVLVRERLRLEGTPTRHLFQPRQFHHVFSAAIPPALRIWPGDTVLTETIDARGADSTESLRTLPGNPLTGPFWVEGAMPGDVLAVHLLRVRTNRKSAYSGSGLRGMTVTPAYFSRRRVEEDSGSTWIIDASARVARLSTSSEALRGYAIALRPMLGGIGVAPGPFGRSDVRGASFLGAYGGNLDYNRVVEGTTVSFQVEHPGALLFIGDGHAAQGDGELTGLGLETSMSVEFSVELLRDKGQIGFPRVEDATHIMSVGIGGSLDGAFRVATAGLARWLETDYKLTRGETAIVMGSAVEYDIAEVVDGEYNVVARLSKAVLRTVTIRP